MRTAGNKRNIGRGRWIAIAIATGVAVLAMSGGNIRDAKWIGASGDDLPLRADQLSVFAIDFNAELNTGSEVRLLFGMNDPRLMDSNMNHIGMEDTEGYAAVIMRITSNGKIAIYRRGFRKDDDESKPLAEFDASVAWSKGENRIRLTSNYGHTDVFVNGNKIGYVGAGPVGNGGDYQAYPVIGDVAVEISGKTKIYDLKVKNLREPGNVLYAVSDTMTANADINLPKRGMPELRTTISTDGKKKIKKVSADVTARGIYDMKVNGRRVTAGYFYPGSTQYNKTHLYNTFDLTPYFKEGDNEINVQLAEGWWSGPSTYVGDNWNFFGDRQSLLAMIEVEYWDGTRDLFPTSPETWVYSTDGPVRYAGFFQGEIYDASVDETERVWKPAVEISKDSTVNKSIGEWMEDSKALRRDFGDKVSAVDTLNAVSMTEPRPGVFVYDFGQNHAGVPYIEFSGLPEGTEVKMRYAEVLYPDMPQYAGKEGMLMTENLRAANCNDTYIAAGKAKETFSPRQTFHGYRYMEITGVPEALPPERVKSLALSSIHKFRSGFECSDTLVNRLWKNIEWSTKSNFISIPTDCPQRNERLGWMGDISVFSPTATKIADVKSLLEQYLQSVRDCQSDDGRFPDVAPTGFGFGGLLWGSAGITVPREHFRQYGDTAVIREHYPAMQRYIEYVMQNDIDPETGLIVQKRQWGDLGDWLSPEHDRNDKSLLWECYFIHGLRLMSEMADIIGKEDDSRYYSRKAEERSEFFRRTYVNPETGKTIYSEFGPGLKGTEVDTQASYALPIAFGIIDDTRFCDNFVRTIERVNKADDGSECGPFSLMTGFIGTAWINEALSKIGRDDIAYRLLTGKDYPSWLYPVTQGASTIWERLNSYTDKAGFGKNNSMNSFNHYSFGAIGNWLLTKAAGIDWSDGELIISPKPDTTGSLTWAKGWMETPSGRVECGWRKEGNKFTVEINSPCDFKFIDPIRGGQKDMRSGQYKISY